jgi:ribosomal protein S18 acetylase RimI-like enzyme
MHFSQVNNVKSKEFMQAMDIYLEAIPPSEQQQIDVIKERIIVKKEQLIIGQENGKVKCMAIIYPLQGTNYVLIDYLAIKREFRQQGIGSKLLRYIQDTYSQKGIRLIGEVEDFNYGNNQEIKKRRMRFYRRSGARVLKDVYYQMPPLQGNQPTPMMLITFNSIGEDKIDGEEIKKIIKQIYYELYNRDSDDPLLNTFINKIPSRVLLV